MKKVMLFLATVTLSAANSLFAAEIVSESKISEVTVYTDSALVTRTANIKLNAGVHQVIFSNIIPQIDENSLKVASKGETEFRLLAAKVKKEFLEEAPEEKVRQIENQIQALEDDIRKLEDNKKVLAEEKAYLDSIRLFSGEQIPKDLVTKMPKAQELDDTLKFLSARLKDNFLQVIDTEINIRELQKKLEVLEKELAQISGPQKKLKRSIVIDIEALKPGALDLSVSYLVGGAAWTPIYDARANFANAEVEIVSAAVVKQRTGEDWQDVELSLSTAKPMIGGRMPYVEPWLLRPYQIQDIRVIGNVLKRKMSYQKEAYVKEEAISEPLAPSTLSIAQEKGIAVVYKLTRKATVKSDGSEHKLPVSSQTLKADFEYSAYPRLVPFAYLGTRVTNAKDLQLLAGRVNIFLEGDFVGTSSIDNIGPQEEFDLYLGVDENVKVKREQISKKVDDVLLAGIPAPNRKTTFKYKTSLENYKSKKIKLIFFEAMPVSEDERIKVKISDASLQPKEKDWKDRKGIWRWELELQPKEKKEIFYTFSVEHPRDMQVEGL